MIVPAEAVVSCFSIRTEINAEKFGGSPRLRKSRMTANRSTPLECIIFALRHGDGT
jgi:hypothetical protein